MVPITKAIGTAQVKLSSEVMTLLHTSEMLNCLEMITIHESYIFLSPSCQE